MLIWTLIVILLPAPGGGDMKPPMEIEFRSQALCESWVERVKDNPRVALAVCSKPEMRTP